MSVGWQLSERHCCPAYACPEMLQPGKYSGKAADIWSLGVILSTLLEGSGNISYQVGSAEPQSGSAEPQVVWLGVRVRVRVRE